jgi:hypothetical protein
MKRSLSVVIMLSVVALLSGCIVSKTPATNDVTIPMGTQMTFSVVVFPTTATYAWTLDEAPLSNTGNSYVYTAQGGKHDLTLKATHIFGTDTQTWHIITPSPPVANAGDDQSVTIDTTVTLDGSGSTDPDNDIVSYHWQQTDGPPVTLADPTVVQPQFIANVPLDSTLSFELTVTDATGLTSTDTCVVLVNNTFNKTYGGSNEDYAIAMQQTSDGGYILAGGTWSFGAGTADAWLIKTDANGNKVWDKTFGGSSEDGFAAVLQTSDGGYILAGHTESFGAGGEDAWLIKTDANGNEVWDKTFGGSNDDGVGAVLQTSDGGYILAGITKSFGAGNGDFWLIKTDANGNEVWDKTFGGSDVDDASTVQQTSDGGYILAGMNRSFGAGVYDAWLIKTDENGNEVWDKTFGGSSEDFVYAVMQTSDGGYTLAGYTHSFGAGDNDAWLIKTDENGNELWDKTFGGSSGDVCYAFQQTSDGGYILAGDTFSFGAGSRDAWLIKTDANGNEVWDKTIGWSGEDGVITIQLLNDDGYILSGWTKSFGAGNKDAWLIKTDADGNAPATPTPG